MAEREHSWDTLRALLMLLGIPFHAALPYSYGANTVVLSQDPSLLAEFVGSLLHAFRMGVFFVVAGYFAAHAIERKGRGPWWAARWRNLAIPLAVGLVCFIPLQIFVRALDLSSGGGTPWPVFVVLLTTPGSHWTGHLWFLVVLLEFCLLTALLWDKVQPALRAMASHYSDQSPLLVAAVIVPAALLPRVVLALLQLDQPGWAAVVELRRFAEYLPFFALGLMLFLSPGFLDSFSRLRISTAVMAVLACIAFTLCDYFGLPLPGLVAKALAGTLVCSALLGIARRYFRRSQAMVTWFVGAAFTIYLFHFPIICLAAYLLETVDIASELRMAIIMVVALAGSAAIHALISRSGVLLLLFNGRRSVPPGQPSRMAISLNS